MIKRFVVKPFDDETDFQCNTHEKMTDTEIYEGAFEMLQLSLRENIKYGKVLSELSKLLIYFKSNLCRDEVLDNLELKEYLQEGLNKVLHILDEFTTVEYKGREKMYDKNLGGEFGYMFTELNFNNSIKNEISEFYNRVKFEHKTDHHQLPFECVSK